MHDFDVKTGFNDATIMFCKRCGKSYALALYRGTAPTKTVWEAMPFVDYQGIEIDPPATPCDDKEG